MDVSQYLEVFIDETNEHLQNLNTSILDLEQNPDNMDTVNEIFRAAHSLKGMAGTMGYKRMQDLTHAMENVFSKVRDGEIKVNSAMIDTIFQCLDAIQEYLDNIQGGGDEGGGFVFVDKVELFGRHFAAALAQDVLHLPANHLEAAARLSKVTDEVCGDFRGVFVRLSQEPQRESKKRVACKKRHGLVELLVAGGLAAPQVGIVHAGQVVVY